MKFPRLAVLRSIIPLHLIVLIPLLTVISGCGGSGGDDAIQTYVVGGTVSGLMGTGLVLQNNGTENLNINSDGSFAFVTRIADLGGYNVTVNEQPSSPAQECIVYNASGTINRANVDNIDIQCQPAPPRGFVGFSSNNLLNWDSVPGNINYTLYWNTTGGVTSSDSSININSNSYSHEHLSNKTTYYYRLSVTTSIGESPLSSEIAVTTSNIQWANPKPDGEINITDIAWNDAAYVVTTNKGIYTSQDTETWVASLYGSSFYGIVWDGAQFVVVGANGAIRTSPNGNTWTTQSSGVTTNLTSVTWTGSQYVVVGSAGTILTSPDALNWNSMVSGVTTDFQDISWSGTILVAVGTNYDAPDLIVTSKDGSAWEVQGIPKSASNIMAVTWTGTRFVAVGIGLVFSSEDAIVWTDETSQGWLYDVVSTGSELVAVGLSGKIVLSVDDGVSWTAQASGTRNDFSSILWTGAEFLAGANHGSIHRGAIGEEWTSTNAITTQELIGISWNGTQFVSVGGAGTILTSPDGNTWTSQDSGTTGALFSVTWSGSQFVAVGSGSIILSSPDGISWTTQSSGLGSVQLVKVIWANNQYMAVGGNGSVITSADGENWTIQDSGTTFRLYDVVWSGSQYVAVGGSSASDATIISSPDGIVWSEQSPGVTQTLYTVEWVDGKYLAGGYGGVLIASPDGIDWTELDYGSSDYIYDIKWVENRFVATGIFGSSKVSFDGTTWVNNNTGTRVPNLNEFAWNGDKLVIVGIYGAILVK